MYLLQLFADGQGPRPIAGRRLVGGVLRIGRDEGADWPIVDPSRKLSRLHCEVAVRATGLTFRSLGANGVLDENSYERLPDGVELALTLPYAVRFGGYRLVMSVAPAEVDRPVPVGYRAVAEPVAAAVREPLLEAFCAGARIDPARLSSAEAAAILHRAGAMYRQTVLGIADLIVERDRARASYSVDAGGIGNAIANPFEWMPAQRLAADLLLAGSPDFLPGSAAIEASFADIRRHLVATDAALRAAATMQDAGSTVDAVTIASSYRSSECKAAGSTR